MLIGKLVLGNLNVVHTTGQNFPGIGKALTEIHEREAIVIIY